MKKSLILTAVILCFAVVVNAQNTFNKGDKVLNFGLGLGNVLTTGTYYKTVVPPISASFEMGIIDNLFDEKSSIGVGGYLGYSSSKYDYYGEYKISNFVISTRGAFHYQLVDKLDTYAGLMLGYNVASIDDSSYDYSGGGFLHSEFIGARYYFKNNFAGMCELGYGIAYLNIGVALKF